MKNLKKAISIIICVAMTLSLSVVAFADEVKTAQNNEDTNVTDTVKKNEAGDETSSNGEETVGIDSENQNSELEAPMSDGTAEPPVIDMPKVSEPVVETPVVNNGEINVKVNGSMVTFEDVKPQIVDGRTLVPFRKVGEALNAAVAWRSTDKTVHCFRNGISIMMTIDKSEMEVRQYEMGDKFVYTTDAIVSPIDPDQPSVKAVTINDRTMIPIRAAAEALGAKVEWDGATNTVVIDIPAYTLSLADKDAAGLVENWNYKPATVLKTATVNVKVTGNFEGAVPTLGDGVVVTLDGKTQTAANGGACTFAEVNAGTYTLTVSSIPEGYTAAETTVTVEAGKEASVSILLEKAANDKDNDNKDNGENSKSDDQQTQKKNETKDNAGNGNNTGSAAENGDKPGDAANK